MNKSGRKRTKDFFISYTSADRKWAEWIASVLESDKHTTVIQSWDFGPGCNFVLEMHKALQACHRVVLVYSPAYFKSLYTQAEWVAALAANVSSDERILLPVRVKRCAPAGLLRPIVYVDLVDVVEKEARKQLLLAARPPQVSRRASVGFPGSRQRAERTAFDVARDLRDVLDTTLITFNAQCEARDKLYLSIRKRLKITKRSEFEDFFHEHFARLNSVELRQHAIIRGYTKDVLRDYNARALKLCEELNDARGEEVDLEEEVPSLWTLHEHLTIWLHKFKTAIRMRSTCLVYVGPAEGVEFPSEVDQELDDLVESNRTGRRRIMRPRSRRGRES